MRFVRIAAAAGLCAALAGCSMMGQQNARMEELLRAPMLTGGYSAIKSALDEWAGASVQLRYPLRGELLSPFLMGDWDGDGQEDAALLYTTAQSTNVWLAVMQKGEDGAWQVKDAVEGLSDTVNEVQFARLQQSEADQILVSYTTAQADQYLAVYSYEQGGLVTILAQPYGQCLLEDIIGDEREDIILLSPGQEGVSVMVELLTTNPEGGFLQVTVDALADNRFTGYASLAAGHGSDGGRYLVLDGWTGASGTNLASVLLRYNEQTSQMEPASQISSARLYEASLRNVSNLTSRDMDGDGIVEIPTQPERAGIINVSQNHRLDFIAWMDYTSPTPQKSFGLLDEEYGYYIALPAAWQGNVMVKDGDGENAVELWDGAGEVQYMTLRLVPSSYQDAGWTRLGIVAGRRLQAKLEPGADLGPGYRLSRALYIL